MHLSANEPPKTLKKVHPIGWDWLAAALLMIGVLLSSGRLAITQATESLFSIQWLATLAALFGLALGRSRFLGWLSAIFAGCYGLFFIPWQFGLVSFPDQEWTDRLRNLGGRLLFSLDQFLTGKNVDDPLLFLVAMAVVFWILAISAGYRLARYGDAWGAILPLGLVALAVQTYDGAVAWRVWFLAGFLVSALLLVARVQLLKRREIWEETHTYIPVGMGAELLGVSLGAAALLVVLAWVTPALASSLDSVESFWSTITQPWRIFQEEVGRALYPLRGTSVNASHFFGEQLSLGRGIPQSPATLFTVRVIQQEAVAPRYYWRDRVYDRYEDGQWQSSLIQSEVWTPSEDELDGEGLEGRSLGLFLFTADTNIFLLHSPAQPLSLNRAAELLFANNEDGTQDLGAFLAATPVIGGESYEAQASIAVATANQLRAAGLEYPDWVLERYLQVPQSMTERTRQLAATITEGLSTPYDKAVAITNYLRRTIEYVDEVPIPPAGVEPIDWMLFDQQQGFCNYYATAEVLMLRSLGVPARLAVGYAQGERENVGGRVRYVVRQRDAHAWPEVYFPTIGWVEFEPTANQDPLIRPFISAEQAAEDLEHPIGPEDELAPPEDPAALQLVAEQQAAAESASRNWMPAFVLFFGVLAIGAALFWNRRRVQEGLALPALLERGLARLDIAAPPGLARWVQLSQLSPLERAYMQINLALRTLGSPPQPGDTPAERSAALSAQLPAMKNDDLQALNREYEARHYGRSRRGDAERARYMVKKIRTATWREVLRRWWQRASSFFHR